MTDLVRSFNEITTDKQACAGGKGGSLARLYQADFPVPDGFVILPAAFIDDKLTAEAWLQIQTHLNQLRSENGKTAFAVRSSAMSEDSAQASFAGEFETLLNVHTDDEIHQAIHTVHSSRQNERVQAYSQAKGLSAEHQVAVIVQNLVPAEVSGVLFTANPVTGQRHQAMISTAWGLGEAIVGGMVTPDILIVDKTSNQVLSRETADKQVMTVLLGNGTEERPVPEKLRRAPTLTDAQALKLVHLGVQIETYFGMPMDIEWALVEEQLTILQARPITALPEPEPPIPTEWKLPQNSYIAMRNNIVELMAEPLTPLFGTLGLQAVNSSMGRQLAEFFGRTGIVPDETIIMVNEYAYYDGSMSFGQIMRILLGSIGIMKRMFTGAVERWTETGRPRYIETVNQWQSEQWRQYSAAEILSAVRALSEAAIDAYMALVSGVIPAAWISEGLFTSVYKILIKRRDDPEAPTFLLGFDSLPIRSEKELYDLAEWIRAFPELSAYLQNTPSQQLAAQLGNNQAPSSVNIIDWNEWQSRFQEHLKEYGHTIYNLDFANPVPADDPAPLLETLKLFISGQGTNPHTRQQSSTEKREQATQAILGRLNGVRRKLFVKQLERAQRYAPLREDGLSDVGLSYPLLRQMLRELGSRFTTSGMIAEPDDIFWLTQEEVEDAAEKVDHGEHLSDHRTNVAERKATWRAANRATPPRALPQTKLTQLKSGQGKKQNGDTLKGVAASPGTVTAPACVVHGPEDFASMNTGDVLVAALTTPAWTPLFARAAAVVTDIGGPLSHGSIVAREYGIPAVLGTDEATKRIQSGQMVTVDGSSGKVTLSPEAGSAQ